MKCAPNVLCQEVAGEAVLLDLDSEQYFGLNDVGARVWRGLASGETLETIRRDLENTYDVDSQTLRADMESLVRELLDAGLLLDA